MTVHVTSNIKVHIKDKEEADDFYDKGYGTSVLQVSSNYNLYCCFSQEQKTRVSGILVAGYM